MDLTPLQQDALTELINIAFSRTAASLSELTSNRVELEVPSVSIHPIGDLTPALRRFVEGEVATVHQIFSGPVAGDGLLLLNHEGAVRVVSLLTGAGTGDRLRHSDKEVLTEVGNILLGACLGIFGDVLQVQFRFTVPRLHLDSLEDLLGSLVIGREAIRHAMVVGANFRLQGSEVSGCLVIVLGVDSLQSLLKAIEEWAERATSAPGE